MTHLTSQHLRSVHQLCNWLVTNATEHLSTKLHLAYVGRQLDVDGHRRALSVDTPGQPDRQRTTAGRRRTSKSLPPHHCLLPVDTPVQPDRRLDIDGHSLSLICRISPPRFLAECGRSPLNQGSFVVLYFVLFNFSGLYLVIVACHLSF